LLWPTIGGLTPLTSATQAVPQSGETLPSPAGLTPQQNTGNLKEEMEGLKAVNSFLWGMIIFLITVLICAITYYFLRKKRE